MRCNALCLECSRLPRKKRSNFNARHQSVFEITRADLSSCDILSVYMYARSIDEDEDKDEEENDKEEDEDENDERE